MIDLDALADDLKAALRWQLAHPGRVDGPEIPWAGRRVWSIFLDLNATRGGNGFGPNPIGYTEIEAWARLNREPVRPWEIEIISALDRAFLEKTGARSGNSRQNHSSQRMTTAMFDAVFGSC